MTTNDAPVRPSATPTMTGRSDPARPGRWALVRVPALALVGLLLGAGVQGTIEAMSAPSDEMWGQLGAVVSAFLIGVPVVVVATLAAFGLARVRWWPAAALMAIGVSVSIARVASDLIASSPTDTPTVWPWSAALGYALAALVFQFGRWPSAAFVVVPVIAVLVVLSNMGAERQREQWRTRAVDSIVSTGLPVLTTDIDGYSPRSATGAPFSSGLRAGPQIDVTFGPHPPGDRSYLDPLVTMHTFARPASFDPPDDCPAANYAYAMPQPARRCTEVGPGVWWSESDRAAITVRGDVIVVLRGDASDPQPQELLVEAAGRVRPTDVDTLVATNR